MGVCTQGALRIPGESRPGSHIPTQGQPALSPPAPVLVWDLVAMLARGVAGMLGGGGGGTRVISTHGGSREAFALQCQAWGQGLLGTGGGRPAPTPSP